MYSLSDQPLTANALRYMGVRGSPDGQTLESVSRHLDWLTVNTPGLTVWRAFDCRADGSKLYLSEPQKDISGNAPQPIDSSTLMAFLGNCGMAVLLAATLGAGFDIRYRQLEVSSMSDAVVFDACASAMIEQVCDLACERIKRVYPTLTGRYSPGYGDFSLEFQPVLLNLLDAGKRIGLTCTRALMLAPSKSVTAVMGVRNGCEPDAPVGKCASCDRAESCPYAQSNEKGCNP